LFPPLLLPLFNLDLIFKNSNFPLSTLSTDLEFTFHRAFDVAKDQRRALNALIDCGVKRILTSGGHPKAFHALDELSSLVKQAEGRISIMPGGGVDEENAATILQVTGAKEIHGSFSSLIPSKVQYFHPRVYFSSKIVDKKRRNLNGGGEGNARRRDVDEGEERNEEDIDISREELAQFWKRRVANGDKIQKVKAALVALEQQMDDLSL
jgi:CutC family